MKKIFKKWVSAGLAFVMVFTSAFGQAADLTIDPGVTVDLTADLTVDGDINNAGTLNLNNNTLSFNGNWTNTGTLNAGTSTVVLNGTDQTITGDNTFYNLTKIVASAATLTLGAGDTQTITNTMNLQGASGQLLSLRSTTPATAANIDPQNTRTIAFLDVQDNFNANATSIDARGTGSDNSGNNTRWIFDSTPDFTWIGLGADNDWSNGDNWAGGSPPGSGDTAIFDGTSTKDATIDTDIDVGGIDINSAYTGTITQPAGNTVTVGSGNFDQDGGTFTGGSNAIDINGDFILNGGTFTSTSGTMSVSTDFTHGGGTFTHNSGTVDLDTVTTTVISGDTTFYNLSSSASGKQITFTAGTTQTVSNTFSLTGTDGNLITLRSSADGAKWDITFPNGSQTVTYADVKDSDANTNTVTCNECTNSGNNNGNWVFVFTPIIDQPADGKVTGRTPTVIGRATTGQTIQILDKDGTVVGTTVADPNGNFLVAVDTLAIGANSLRPKDSSVTGAAVSITVKSPTQPTEVPVIEVPEDNSRLVSLTPTVTGTGKAGEAVTIKAKDAQGNLLLSNVGTGTVDGNGNYSVTLSTTLPKGNITLTAVVDNVASDIVTIILTDPFGIVFDAQSNEPVEAAIVSIYRVADDELAVAGVDLDDDDENPATTGTDGFYSFFTADNDYYIVVEAFGYNYPTIIPTADLPEGRTIVTGSKGEDFTVAGTIIEMDHPMDKNADQLVVTKEANRDDVLIGDVVTYTVTIENPTSNNAPNVLLVDRIPAGFKFVADKVLLDGVKIDDPTGGRPLSFELGSIAPGVTKTLKYQLVVGSGVEPGTYTNLAWAGYSGGRKVSNDATEQVQVEVDPLFDLGTVIGRVYVEGDMGGELNLGGIRIVMEDGTVITTDENGMYSVPGLTPGRHLLRLDERTLPAGYVPATRTRVELVDIREGMPRKVNFPIKPADGEVETQSKHQRLYLRQQKSGAQPRLHAGVYPPEIVWQDNNFVEPLEFHMFTNYAPYITSWTLTVRDADTGKVVRTFRGNRDEMDEPVIWNGLDREFQTINPGFYKYEYVLEVVHTTGQRSATEPVALAIDVSEETGLLKPKDKALTPKERKEREEKRYIWRKEQQQKNSLSKDFEGLKGHAVTVQGLNPRERVRILREGQVVIEQAQILPPQEDGLVDSDEAGSVEVILPEGNYSVEVESPRDGTIVLDEIEVTEGADDDYLFFVGIGDARVGYTVNEGDIEPVQSNDKFQEGFYLEDKVAFYLEGKVLGKYLITASYDTDRDRKEIFRGVDKDKYYPVYGDSSTVDYSATDTQGNLFVLIEFDRSEIKWGNFQTGFTETEFARFNRSLYGGRAELVSTSDTRFGEPTQKLILFQAKAQQRSARNEFTGTGGSVYILKHQDVIAGSETVTLQVRDQITGLVTSTVSMSGGSDYLIDYSTGRIRFRLPVTMLANSGSIINSEALDGDPVYVVVDYAYDPADDYQEGAYGARARQAVTDFVQVGGTYINESQQDNDYQLQAVDVTVRGGLDVGRRTLEAEGQKGMEQVGYDSASSVQPLTSNDITYFITAEYAESQSEAVGNFVSTDGGLTFTELAIGESASGAAFGISGQTKIAGRLGLTGHFKRIGSDFSTESLTSQQGKELYGFGGVYDFAQNTRLAMRYDVQELIDGGNAQTQEQVGAQKTTTTSMQLIHQIRRLKLTAEWQRRVVEEKIAGAVTSSNQEGDTIAIKGEYEVSDKTTVALTQQATTEGEPNYRTTVGLEHQLTERVTVSAEHSGGTEGPATRVGVGTDVNDNLRLVGDYKHKSPVNGKTQEEAMLGADLTMDTADDTKVTTFGGLSVKNGVPQTNLTFSSIKQMNEETTFSTGNSFTHNREADIRDRTYELARAREGKDLILSMTERQNVGEEQTSSTNIYGIEGDINKNWSAYGTYERGTVQDLQLNESDRHALSAGVGYTGRDPETGRITLTAQTRAELRLDDGETDRRSYNIYQKVEGRPTENLSIYVEGEYSLSEQTMQDIIDEEYKELVLGAAYRPIKFDDLNLLARYTFLESSKPSGQSSIEGFEKEIAHVLAGEAIYDLNERWQLTEKLAMRVSDTSVTDFAGTRSITWMVAQGVGYQLTDNWRLYGEYRFMRQELADDFKQGAQIEVSRRVGDHMDIGIGYEMTDFTDDLTDMDYRAHGPYFRVTGLLYDLTEEQRYEIMLKREASKVMKMVSEKANAKIKRLRQEAGWTEGEAEKFFRKEVEALLGAHHLKALEAGKEFPLKEIYIERLQIELDRSVKRFMKVENKDRRKEVKQHYRDGMKAFKSGDLLNAMDHFERLMDIDPTYKDAAEMLDMIYDIYASEILRREEAKAVIRQMVTLVKMHEMDIHLLEKGPRGYIYGYRQETDGGGDTMAAVPSREMPFNTDAVKARMEDVWGREV